VEIFKAQKGSSNSTIMLHLVNTIASEIEYFRTLFRYWDGSE